jgi:hypothetical protein
MQLLIDLSLTVKCMRPLESRRRGIAIFHFKFAGWMGVSQNPDGGHGQSETTKRAPSSVRMPASPEYARNRKLLFDNQHFPGLNKGPCSELIEVHTAREAGRVELHLVASRSFLFVHKHRHHPTKEVVDSERRILIRPDGNGKPY